MIREIVKYKSENSEILREYAKPVLENNEKTIQVIQDLKDTMSKISNAAGLAAPQIGESLRIFITKNYKNNTNDFLVFINPTINEVSIQMVKTADGCLSIPNVSTTTNRHSFINVTYLNENFKSITEELSGFQSVVFQHENDHLNGKLFIDLLEEEENKLINETIDRNLSGEKLLFVNGRVVSLEIRDTIK
jgi:peptide deformylase